MDDEDDDLYGPVDTGAAQNSETTDQATSKDVKMDTGNDEEEVEVEEEEEEEVCSPRFSICAVAIRLTR